VSIISPDGAMVSTVTMRALSATPGSVRTAAPHAGEHTEAVLRELGLSAAEALALREKKIVA